MYSNELIKRNLELSDAFLDDADLVAYNESYRYTDYIIRKLNSPEAIGEGAIMDLIEYIIEAISKLFSGFSLFGKKSEEQEEVISKARKKAMTVSNYFHTAISQKDQTTIKLDAEKGKANMKLTRELQTYVRFLAQTQIDGREHSEEDIIDLITTYDNMGIDKKVIENNLLLWAIHEGFTLNIKLFHDPNASKEDGVNHDADKDIAKFQFVLDLVKWYIVSAIAMISMESATTDTDQKEQLAEAFFDSINRLLAFAEESGANDNNESVDKEKYTKSTTTNEKHSENSEFFNTYREFMDKVNNITKDINNIDPNNIQDIQNELTSNSDRLSSIMNKAIGDNNKKSLNEDDIKSLIYKSDLITKYISTAKENVTGLHKYITDGFNKAGQADSKSFTYKKNPETEESKNDPNYKPDNKQEIENALDMAYYEVNTFLGFIAFTGQITKALTDYLEKLKNYLKFANEKYGSNFSDETIKSNMSKYDDKAMDAINKKIYDNKEKNKENQQALDKKNGADFMRYNAQKNVDQNKEYYEKRKAEREKEEREREASAQSYVMRIFNNRTRGFGEDDDNQGNKPKTNLYDLRKLNEANTNTQPTGNYVPSNGPQTGGNNTQQPTQGNTQQGNQQGAPNGTQQSNQTGNQTGNTDNNTEAKPEEKNDKVETIKELANKAINTKQPEIQKIVTILQGTLIAVNNIGTTILQYNDENMKTLKELNKVPTIEEYTQGKGAMFAGKMPFIEADEKIVTAGIKMCDDFNKKLNELIPKFERDNGWTDADVKSYAELMLGYTIYKYKYTDARFMDSMPSTNRRLARAIDNTGQQLSKLGAKMSGDRSLKFNQEVNNIYKSDEFIQKMYKGLGTNKEEEVNKFINNALNAELDEEGNLVDKTSKLKIDTTPAFSKNLDNIKPRDAVDEDDDDKEDGGYEPSSTPSVPKQ